MAQKRHRWTQRDIAMLGTMPDEKIAEILGIEESQVRHKRYTLRAPMLDGSGDQDEPEEKPRRGRKPRNWTNEELALIGKMSDSDLAKVLGLTQPTVRDKRNSLGIDPYDPDIEYEEDNEIEDKGEDEEELDEPEEPVRSEAPRDSVMIEEALSNKARFISVQNGVSLSDYLSDMLRDGINQDYDKALAKLAQEYEPKTSR